MNKNLKVSEDILIFALRYCLPKSRAVAEIARNYVIALWGELDAEARKYIKKEVEVALARGDAGEEKYAFEWFKILDLPA